MNQRYCHVCKRTDQELRPYGENAQDICFDCAMLPERQDQTTRQFIRQVVESGPIVVVGTEHGPYPFAGTRKPS